MRNEMMKLLIFVAVSIGFLGTVYGQDPEIAETILPEIKRVGLTGRLRCVVINQMDNPVYWIHRDTQTHLSKDDKIEIDDAHNLVENSLPKYEVEHEEVGESNVYTIIINRLERRDAGNYTCQVNVRGSNTYPSKDGRMVVLVPPSILQSSTSHTVTVKEGDNLNLTCKADGYPSPNVTWVRVSGAVLPHGKLRHVGTVLPVNSIRTKDRGIYRCLADNAVRPPAVYDTTVLVNFKPVARPVQTSYGQAENRMFDITIECRVAGWPEADLQWYKELDADAMTWEPINNNDKHTVNILLNHANILNPQERWFQLVIRSVTANDFGYYICEGRNQYGTGHTKIKLFATSECQGPNCPEEQAPDRSNSNIIRLSSIWVAAFMSVLLLTH